MKNIDWREFIAGALFSAVGIAVALYASSHYQVGSAARMGPGYFPTMLGWVLAALGVVIALLSSGQAGPLSWPFAWPSLAG